MTHPAGVGSPASDFTRPIQRWGAHRDASTPQEDWRPPAPLSMTGRGFCHAWL